MFPQKTSSPKSSRGQDVLHQRQEVIPKIKASISTFHCWAFAFCYHHNLKSICIFPMMVVNVCSCK